MTRSSPENIILNEIVSYGMPVNLMADENYEKLKPIWELNKAIGLPTCLAELELVHTPYPVSKEFVKEAIRKLESFNG